ncbi:hypothetical protein CHS0354_017951 [Potamilus streckersoni]|uniref:Fructose-2,6-bisphosphatase TIGAR n=1 Tax=Potamilus streckersoni TaxID=2493646 RepID=A0AAE0RW01_9BIVA|nr:hypothetical protein CHS0354_017951 [Potamilus streckersoni]
MLKRLMMVLFSLTVVRHGETSYNRKAIIQGQTDIPLSSIGVEQARLAGHHLQNERFTHVFSSDLLRASQTAQVIMEGNKVSNCSIKYDKRLRERKFGSAEGKSSKDLVAAAKKARKKLVDYTPFGAETIEQVRERVESFFSDLIKLFLSSSEMEDTSYTPGTIKRRHGGSLGRNSGPNKRQEISRRSQSFCVPGNIENIMNEINRQVDLAENEISCNEELDSLGSSEQNIPGISENDDRHKDEDNFVVEQLSLSTSEKSKDQQDDKTYNKIMFINGDDLSTNGDFSDDDVDDSSMQDSMHLNNIQVFQMPDKDNRDSNKILSHSCPNVSLSPLISHRLPSVSSISSGRNSSFDDGESFPLTVADILVVSHGGFMKELIHYFVEKLGCKLPGGKCNYLQVCPNASISKFNINLDEFTGRPSLTCLIIHNKDHLAGLGVGEAEGKL